MSQNYEDVVKFADKFGIPRLAKPGLLDDNTFCFRVGHLREEVEEFTEAHCDGDLEAAADALADLVYVAIGTAVCMGIPWDRVWDEVQRANMEKVRARTAGDSKRGNALDVVKPAGWRKPDHSWLVRKA